MIVKIIGNRQEDFPKAPYGKSLVEFKENLNKDIRKKLQLKDTDAVLIEITG